MFYLAPALKKIQRRLAVPTLLLLAAGGHADAQQHSAVPPAAVVARAEMGADSAQDGLTGPVRRVRTEVAGLLSKDGKLVEGPRALMEVTVYDRQGRKVDRSVYAVPGGQPAGKEVYKHDARGNVVEMTVLDEAGSVASQEVYAYDLDALGNWTKMTTSVAVVENGNVTYEPTEVTHRTITYYRTDAVAKATVAPAVQAEEAIRAAAAQNPQKNEAADTDAPKPLAGPAADGEYRAAAGQQAASVRPANVPVVEAAAAPRPPAAPAENFNSAGGAMAAAEAAGDGGPTVSEPATAAPPRAGESEAGPTLTGSSGGVLNGRAIDLPRPAYSESARRRGYEGTVTVKVDIDVTGRVISAHAVSGPHHLRAAAVEAARRARFSPTLRSGRPMETSGVINYVFSLQQ